LDRQWLLCDRDLGVDFRPLKSSVRVLISKKQDKPGASSEQAPLMAAGFGVSVTTSVATPAPRNFYRQTLQDWIAEDEAALVKLYAGSTEEGGAIT
jgi:hypothetical protein